MAKNALLHCNRERSDIDLAVSGGGVDRFEELLERGGYCMQKFENFVNSSQASLRTNFFTLCVL
jgi:hypothetical protein